MPETEQDHNPTTEAGGYDRQEANAKVISLFGGVTIAVVIAAVFGVQYYYDISHERQVYVKVLEPVSSEIKDLRAREDQQLHSYEYINREQGTVRLPIERAMELVAADYRSGAMKYPTTPYPVKPEEEPHAQ